jgi:methionyl-tRNA synthetase
MSKVIITATPPTPNGDLHVGHVSGPYLAADVHARFLRSRGVDVSYISSSDDNQSYVVTTAQRMKVKPRELAAQQAALIQSTLSKASIAIDAFTVPDRRHNELVQGFFRRLYEQGALTRKKKSILWCKQHDHQAFESYLRGYCPTCFASTAGGICETCGHPNDATTILDPQCSIDPSHTLERRDADVIVLELERHREQIRDFYRDKAASWRFHPIQLVNELLEAPLPDYPITYMSNWGVPAPFEGFEGHVLNVWAEMLPGFMRTMETAHWRSTGNAIFGEGTWHPATGNKLIQFLGYDNSFFFTVAHLALAFASRGSCILPTAIVTNEFYQLENFKFSTSKNHAIWARDLLDRRNADEVRFYLALSNPETQKSNFTEFEMDKVLDARLGEPWQALARSMRGAFAPASDTQCELSDHGRAIAAHAITTFQRCYEVETFSMQRAAEQFSQLLVWLRQRADSGAQRGGLEASRDIATIRTIARLLPALIAPLLPDFAVRLDRALGQVSAARWPTADALSSQPAPVPELGGVLRGRPMEAKRAG